MNGAKSLVQTLLDCGVDTCFANPGTSEMHFVAALDQVPGMRCVLGLQENVVTGMADGYFRIARQPACTLLHCGPGLANGLANLHNARRARSGVVNIIGDQAVFHRPFDAPLTADTTALARSVSHWVRTSTSTADLGRDAAEAVRAARAAADHMAGQVASLILPADISWQEGGVVAAPLPALPAPAIDPHAVEVAARILREQGANTLLLLAGPAVSHAAQRSAWRIAQASGATLMADFTNAQVPRGRGCLPLARVPYVMPAAIQALERFKHIILVNAKAPVGFFGYPETPSTQYAADTQLHVLARPEQDGAQALADLARALGAPDIAIPAEAAPPPAASGSPTPEGMAQTLAALLPHGAIVTDESVSFGRSFYKYSHAAAAHDWLHQVGGAIGAGLPMAAGAALGAQRQRRVINLQADGSAMYTVQALWTQARERLPVTTILIKNGKYNILLGEYQNVGAKPGATAMSMLDLGKPDIDWVALAGGMGVEAAQATTMERCADLLRASFAQERPFLIELVV